MEPILLTLLLGHRSVRGAIPPIRRPAAIGTLKADTTLRREIERPLSMSLMLGPILRIQNGPGRLIVEHHEARRVRICGVLWDVSSCVQLPRGVSVPL